jgi:hypothetical protein
MIKVSNHFMIKSSRNLCARYCLSEKISGDRGLSTWRSKYVHRSFRENSRVDKNNKKLDLRVRRGEGCTRQRQRVISKSRIP